MPDPAEALLQLLMWPGDSPDLPTLDDLLHRPDWQRRAACRGEDPNTFVVTGRSPTYDRPRELCAGCPVRAECLDYAMSDSNLVGWWAGTTERERAQMRKATG